MTSSEVQIAPAPQSTGVERPCWLWYIPELPSSSERPSGPDCRACISGVCMNPVCRVALAATVATIVAMPAVAAQSSAAPLQPRRATAGRAAAARRNRRPPRNRRRQPQEPKDPTYEETVVVSASRTEQKLVDAPATMTVIGADKIENATSQNFAELLRTVPGLNITQVSARDINVTSRAPTGTLATGQLAVLDGRSLYQDFFGFVMWDFLPVNLNEIKQIEVIRGPASAVWGANAVFGVINVITKSPREMQGTTATVGLGTFDAHQRRRIPGRCCTGAAPTRRPSTIAGRSSCRSAATSRIRCRVRRASSPVRRHPAPQFPPFRNTRHHTAEVRRPARLRLRGRREALLHGRHRRHRRHHAHGHRPVRHRQRLAMGYGRVSLPAEGAPRGGVRAAPRRRRHQPDCPRSVGRPHPVRVQDEHGRRGVVEREYVRHAPRRHLRRQPAAQHVRSLDCAAERQPHGVRRLRPGRDLPVESLPLDARARGWTASTTWTTSCSRRGPRS